jgi:rhodanese-related sulfurtransferase
VSGLLHKLFPPRPKATPEQARELQRHGAVLLYVREDGEWRAGHAQGAQPSLMPVADEATTRIKAALDSL